MADDGKDRHRAVPSSRLGRIGGFGRLAGGVAGGMMAEGARRLASGERPTLEQIMLTPGNARRLADRLGHMRGAAMKLGQMISMDAGYFLPPELAAILATLRDRADFMPARQLDGVLAKEWGKDWRRRFRRFEPRPIAAASIGQVHRAMTRDGRVLAIKVQYPGIAASIDADVDNVAGLLKISGLLPRELDIAPLLAAAKQQLREEADYRREGAQMRAFAERLSGEPGFTIPRLDDELSTGRILAMSYEEGVPIESMADESQELRNDIMARLIDLVGRELFDFGVMQTDPNFANYRYNHEQNAIVLLDFGATREVSPQVQASYRTLLEAGLSNDRDAVRHAAVSTGFIGAAAITSHAERIDRMIDVILGEMNAGGPFDFGDRAFVPVFREEGTAIARDRATWHLPPTDTLFVQRKISGTALLAARLQAVVNVRDIVSDILQRTSA
ncbi:ABC1 kinase family protein [Pseudopontixanthobacter vadosimaris]|uniref:ABC1 kinase family protein n=1 Tax=Pseudopontixanthobacter vadosimaris TaxID=2726450 RepID=UPI001472F035|nr:AarF/ABC1/UbiB kinase family protein [Pseudopontixanthobacter vadosimaris]